MGRGVRLLDVRFLAICAPSQASKVLVIVKRLKGFCATGVETATAKENKDGPERNSSVFPQETEPETGRGGAGESEHTKT